MVSKCLRTMKSLKIKNKTLLVKIKPTRNQILSIWEKNRHKKKAKKKTRKVNKILTNFKVKTIWCKLCLIKDKA